MVTKPVGAGDIAPGTPAAPATEASAKPEVMETPVEEAAAVVPDMDGGCEVSSPSPESPLPLEELLAYAPIQDEAHYGILRRFIKEYGRQPDPVEFYVGDDGKSYIAAGYDVIDACRRENIPVAYTQCPENIKSLEDAKDYALNRYLARQHLAAIYEELFSDNGKYCVSSFTYPHTVPGFHFHSALGYQLFEQRHKVRARAGCKTNIEKWEALPHDEKLIGLRAFYNAPTISLKEDVKKKMCALYRQNLINIFGAGSVEGCSDDQLLWATYMPLKLESHRRSKGVYMKNKQLTYLDDAVVRYDKTSKLVTVKFYSRRSGKRRVRTYDVPTFIRECLVKPGRGFFGLRFYARGAYHGRSGFKSVLEFAYRYPEALPEYDRIRRNAEELDVNQSQSQEVIAPGSAPGDGNWWRYPRNIQLTWRSAISVPAKPILAVSGERKSPDPTLPRPPPFSVRQIPPNSSAWNPALPGHHFPGEEWSEEPFSRRGRPDRPLPPGSGGRPRYPSY